MSYYLRVIPKRADWIKYELNFPDWIEENDIPADPLKDFPTTENAISVFLIEDKSNILKVAAAYSSNRFEGYKDIDYILINKCIIDDLEIEVNEINSDTADTIVNKLHYHLARLGGLKLCQIINRIYKDGLDCGAVDRKEIIEVLVEGIKDGTIKENKMKKNLLNKLIEDGYLA